jgi:hypothetical protein
VTSGIGAPGLMRRTLVLVPAFLLLAGCGTEPSTFDDSGEELKDAGSSRIEWRMEQKPPTWWPFSTTAGGSIDYDDSRGELIVELKGNAGPKTGLHALFIGRDSYLGVPYKGKLIWQKSSDPEVTGADRLAPGPGGSTPDEVLDVLMESSEQVETLGNDEIRGVSAKHYRAHIDEKELGENADLYPPGGLVIDAWIDDHGLLRRIRIPFGGNDDPVEVIDLYDFGVPVDVEAPPADQVLSEGEFRRVMMKECDESSDEADDATAACMLFGGSGWTSYGPSTDEIDPTETIPRRVSDY